VERRESPPSVKRNTHQEVESLLIVRWSNEKKWCLMSNIVHFCARRSVRDDAREEVKGKLSLQMSK